MQLKRAFQGGFTHANAFCVNKVVDNVYSEDLTSAYPANMVAEPYPISAAEVIENKDLTPEIFKNSLKYYCCLFDIHLKNVRAKKSHENYISSSRCRATQESLFNMFRPKDDKGKTRKNKSKELEGTNIDWSQYGLKNAIINNGRLVEADEIYMTITEIDFAIIKEYYDFDLPFQVGNFRRYKKSYLPRDFVISILDLYKAKTVYKGIEGKESEYAHGKETINSSFGMTCTDIVREIIVYNYDAKHPEKSNWKESKYPNINAAIKKYNTDNDRFLFYAWGVWITAYTRRNLFAAISALDSDYIYSDTDSVKFKNYNKHKAFFDAYNKNVREKLIKAMQYHKLDESLIEPTTADGVKKCLGVWEFDGHYSKFKTIGAKRYLVQYSNDPRNKEKKRGKCELTVAGMDKNKPIIYLKEKFKDNIFDGFNTNLIVPAEYSGKMTHTYIDEPRRGNVVDYLGVKGSYYEMSGVHLENSSHSLNWAESFKKYLLSIEFAEVD